MSKKNLSRRDFLKFAGIGALSSFSTVFGRTALENNEELDEISQTARLPKAKPDSPNILVIVVDALRADHLSGYGYHRNTSPFIDSLAKTGTLFQNAISASSWTQPSHASLLTGRYVYDHQAELKPLDNRFPTIGEMLQLEGYRTGAFSGNTEFFTRRQGFGRGFLHFEDDYQSVQDDVLNSSLFGFLFDYYGLRKALKYGGTPGRKYAENTNQSILKWIDRDKTSPFFVFVNYFDVHDPYLPPEPYRSKYTSVQNPGGLINGFLEHYSPDLTPEQVQSEMASYDGAISYVDDQIKYLLNEFKQRGLLENTLVVFTSDHGESFGEHGFFQHSASLYIQEVHVPLIFWWPGHIPANRSIDVPVTNSAISATILSLIKAQTNPFPGPALDPLIFGQIIEGDWPDPVSELAQFTGASPKNPSTHGAMSSVFNQKLHYIVHEKFGEELYAWVADHPESNNVIGDSSLQSFVGRFRNYLKKLIGKLILSIP